MATLIVTHNGEELYNLELAKGREYLIGRSQSSDIVLNKSSVSRTHFKFFYDSESWHLESIAKNANVFHQGRELQSFIFNRSETLSIEGYEFRFLLTTETPETLPKNPAYVPVEGQNLSPDATNTRKSEASVDKTSVLVASAVPCLYAVNERTGQEILYTLTGSLWVGGRSSSCQVHLQESKASRKHFELARTSMGFELVDLGSSNGTYVNGKRLQPQQRILIELGAQIRVGNTTLTFQMRNPDYEKQLEEIAGFNQYQDEGMVGVSPRAAVQLSTGSGASKSLWGTQLTPALMVRLLAVGITAIAIFVYFVNSQSNKGELTLAAKSPIEMGRPAPLAAKDPEHQKLIENTYQLAKSLFIQQKYQSAKVEIQKLHSLISFYSDSRTMEKFINDAIQIEDQREQVRLRQQKQQEMEMQVSSTISDCEGRLTELNTVSKLEKCLSTAIELDPENDRIRQLLNQTEQKEERRKSAQLAKEGRDALEKKGLVLIQEAARQEEKGDLLKALELYKKFANSNYPKSKDHSASAMKHIDSISEKIKTNVTKLQVAAEQSRAQEKYKEAYQSLAQAMKLDPTDSRTLQAMNNLESELKRKMKMLYNDGVLEENIGNIETAKLKWKSIKALDLETGEYFRKAVTKLKRYGE